MLVLLSLSGDDCGGNLQELVCLERGSTDQATVNAILDGVITGVASVHAAAVQQRDIFCGVTEDASQGLKYHSANDLGGGLRSRRLAGTYGPDGLVGHYQIRRISDPRKSGADLTTDEVGSLASFSLF